MNRTTDVIVACERETAQRGDASLSLLHRTRPTDAFPVSWARTGDSQFSVRAQWPHNHPFFSPVTGHRYDPLLVAETIRQTGLLVVHAGYGVPIDYSLLLSDVRYSCNMDRLAVEHRTADVDIDVICVDAKRRRGELAHVSLKMVIWRAGRVAATGVIRARLVSRPVYHRLREGRTTPQVSVPDTPAIAPRLVGRCHEGDVLLSETSHELVWGLRVDTGHPTLFQRPNDHVPGMLLLEAARQAGHAGLAGQAGQASTPFVPASGEIAFHRYAEFARPCLIQAHLPGEPGPGSGTVRVTGSQDDELVFVAAFSNSGIAQ